MKKKSEIRDSRFPVLLFFIYLGSMLLVSGIHIGLIVGMNLLGVSEILQTHLILLYWIAAAAALTVYTRWEMRRRYEKPMHDLAEATHKVVGGDFSVYVPPTHTSDRLDYIDVMLVDFNKMVEGLGNVETLRTDFFSNVSHEIKTPLAQIQNNAELLQHEALTDEQMQYAHAIYTSSRRLSQLIGNMLKLNKLERQTILPEAEDYDLCAQLAECAVGFETFWERQDIEFDADLEDRRVIHADASLMELVWNNLLSNAIKFTPAGGQVILTERIVENEIRVSVSDTGCGMTPETQSRIFEKFYQGDTSHAMAGNGLGLALVQRILQLNGFGIEVESAPGEGSTFTVMIPMQGEESGR